MAADLRFAGISAQKTGGPSDSHTRYPGGGLLDYRGALFVRFQSQSNASSRIGRRAALPACDPDGFGIGNPQEAVLRAPGLHHQSLGSFERCLTGVNLMPNAGQPFVRPSRGLQASFISPGPSAVGQSVLGQWAIRGRALL